MSSYYGNRFTSLMLFFEAFIILLACSYLGCYCKTIPRVKVPVVFSDLMLPLGQRNGQDFGPLGHILKLDTFLPPKRALDIETGFSIFNRRQSTENLVFKFGQKYCVDQIQGNSTKEVCYGEFPVSINALAQSQFKPNTRTIIMISGFMTNGYLNSWLERTKDLWLELDDVDVILVTWANANKYLYSRAVADTPLVARQITIFLHYLAEMSNTHLLDHVFTDNIHFIGHSLGAHIGAYIGQDLGRRLGRITGLDPAGPSFDQMSKDRRLDTTDAQFVDAIHTNSGQLRYANFFLSAGLQAIDSLLSRVGSAKPLLERLSAHYSGEGDTAWFGIDSNVGHLDYYANGGRVQPGCNDIMHLCDHGRSTKLYESILRYELAMKNSSKTERKSGRLLAFASNDYPSFSSGQNLDTFCPSSLKLAQPSSDPLTSCSIPIDLVTPTQELKYELSSKYGLNFNPVGNNLKYYFKTTNSKPFVGIHYLLKIHLSALSSWNQNCALQAAISMNDEIGTSIDINKELKIVNNSNFLGLAIPFVNPFGDEVHGAFRELVRKFNNKTKQMDSIQESLAKVLPTHINLSITSARSSLLMESARNSLLHFFAMGPSRRLPESCRLIMTSIEIEPLTGSTHRLASTYVPARQAAPRSTDSANNSTSSGFLQLKPRLVSVKEHGLKLRQARTFSPLVELAGQRQEEASLQLDTFTVFSR